MKKLKKMPHKINDFQLKVENLSKDNVGLGWQGLLGKIKLIIDGEEIFFKDFELTSTLNAFYRGVKELFEKRYVVDDFFCCTCGDHGCFYVRWWLKLENDEVLIKMENLISEPIGKHIYSINISKFLDTVLGLFDDAIRCIEKKSIKQLNLKPSLQDLKKMKEELKSYL